MTNSDPEMANSILRRTILSDPDAGRSISGTVGYVMEHNTIVPEPPPRVLIPLFVIERSGLTDVQYWICSAEHGCGWHPNTPKQAFSPSELANEIRRMIREGYFQDCRIRQLSLG